jgi:hypothetical protein
MNDNNDDFIPLQMPSADEENNELAASAEPEEGTSTPQSALPTMRTVKDLVNTLARMNKKLIEMEAENNELRQELDKKVAKREVVQMISKIDALGLPKNGLFSDSFLIRALSIYGHWFVINIVISIIMGIISFILFASMFNQIATNIMNSGM